MPKVSAEYINNKKNLILEAALSVCKGKPLYEVTMQDIIKEAGISHGGIYRYFSDIDDVLIALLNKSSDNEEHYKQEIDAIIENPHNANNAVKSIFDFFGKYIKENMITTGKFLFEIEVLLVNHPDRGEKLLSQITKIQTSQYITQRLFKEISEGVQRKEFKPIVPISDIFGFIGTSLDGIVRDSILAKLYGEAKGSQSKFDKIGLINTLLKAVMIMLGSHE